MYFLAFDSCKVLAECSKDGKGGKEIVIIIIILIN